MPNLSTDISDATTRSVKSNRQTPDGSWRQ